MREWVRKSDFVSKINVQLNLELVSIKYIQETLRKGFPCKVIIFTKFHEDRTKIVDFLLMADFEHVSFFSSDFIIGFFLLFLPNTVNSFC